MQGEVTGSDDLPQTFDTQLRIVYAQTLRLAQSSKSRQKSSSRYDERQPGLIAAVVLTPN